MIEMDHDQLGKRGYEAYAVSTGGKTYDGRDMPTWDQLPERIRQAWIAAAADVKDAVLEFCK